MTRHDSRSARGATLIELLVVASTIVVLLGLTIPVVRQLRVHHDNLANLNNLGATAKDFAAWALDHDGVSVNAGLPAEAGGNRFYEEIGPGIDPVWQYRNHMSDWPSILYFSGFEPSPHWQATSGPGGTQSWADLAEAPDIFRYVTVGSRYNYPDPMWTESFVWTDPGIGPLVTEEYAAFYKRVRMDQVAAPGRKGLLVYEQSLNDDDARVSLAFVDGHVSRHPRSDAAPMGVHPLSVSGSPGRVAFTTLSGFEGVDF